MQASFAGFKQRCRVAVVRQMCKHVASNMAWQRSLSGWAALLSRLSDSGLSCAVVPRGTAKTKACSRAPNDGANIAGAPMFLRRCQLYLVWEIGLSQARSPLRHLSGAHRLMCSFHWRHRAKSIGEVGLREEGWGGRTGLEELPRAVSWSELHRSVASRRTLAKTTSVGHYLGWRCLFGGHLGDAPRAVGNVAGRLWKAHRPSAPIRGAALQDSA